MLFNSLEFAIFFPIVTLLYFLLPHRWRWGMLLAASCVFYMAFIPAYILILFFLILIDYFAGILIDNSASASRRKFFLVASLVANVGVLFSFKYYEFFGANLEALAKALHWNYSIGHLALILPVGLSFHTFQSMSYTIEVYLRRQRAERHLGIYALYVMFYPQLVAGPIERPQNLLHQFYEKHSFEKERFFDGIKLMAGGLFKKVIIADRLAVLVNQAYAEPGAFSGLYLLLMTYFFTFQILCDFSGYTDIARGAAKVMGFQLMENFRRPYFSRSIGEFWRRWHISLSTWFRDYLYVPLGGNQVAPARNYFNLVVVFVVSGLWHGANWTFILWGLFFGICLVSSRIFARPMQRMASAIFGAKDSWAAKALSIFFVFQLVNFAWVLFRAPSVQEAWAILRRILSPGGEWARMPANVSGVDIGLGILLIFALWLTHALSEKHSIYDWLKQLPRRRRWVFYGLFAVATTILMATNSPPPQKFIYFQF